MLRGRRLGWSRLVGFPKTNMAVARSRIPTTRARALEFEKKAFYAPAEIAKLLGISTQTVLDRIHDGSLYGVRISPRIYRVPLGGLMQFLGEPPRIKRRVWRGKDADRFWARLEKEEQRRSR